jgi:hypothetical protein
MIERLNAPPPMMPNRYRQVSRSRRAALYLLYVIDPARRNRFAKREKILIFPLRLFFYCCWTVQCYVFRNPLEPYLPPPGIDAAWAEHTVIAVFGLTIHAVKNDGWSL